MLRDDLLFEKDLPVVMKPIVVRYGDKLLSMLSDESIIEEYPEAGYLKSVVENILYGKSINTVEGNLTGRLSLLVSLIEIEYHDLPLYLDLSNHEYNLPCIVEEHFSTGDHALGYKSGEPIIRWRLDNNV
jgi:hypothetical protein